MLITQSLSEPKIIPLQAAPQVCATEEELQKQLVGIFSLPSVPAAL